MGAGSTIEATYTAQQGASKMGGLGWPELLIIILIVVILFGARRIPEVARGLGEGIRSFKSGMHGDDQRSIDEKRYSEDVGRKEESRGRA
jgi:sec-independent protein translocase protein TatA